MSRLLLVEDDRAAVFGMQQFLEAEGYVVDVAGTLPQALERLRRQAYRAVITDWALSSLGCEGEAVVRAAREKGAKVKIVVITAQPLAEVQPRAAAAGADAVLQKPVPMAALRAHLPPPRRQRRTAKTRTKGKKR